MFFIKSKQSNGMRRPKIGEKRKKMKKPPGNEEITSSEEEKDPRSKADQDSSEDEYETAQEKKIRLAKVYLQEIEKEEKARLEKEEVDESVILKRLKKDYLKESGKLRLDVADHYKSVDKDNIQILKCREQKNCLTCSCISSDDKYLFVGSKDGVVVKYSLLSNNKVGVIKHVDNNETKKHGKKVCSIAISTDSKFLAIGDESNGIYIWDPLNLKFIKKLSGHKNVVTGLCLKKDSHTLYSCSVDRTVKVWNLDDMAYVETLFGHQDAIVSIDTLYKDRVVSSGGNNLRVWKITEESQLIYNGHIGNIDIVRMINEENFISGGDDGEICIWSMMRKKPICVIKHAHGEDPVNQQPYWINSIASLMNTDLVASGSQDGFIRLWKLGNNFKSITLLMEIPVEGFINYLNFTSDGTKLIAAVSREHKLGRWSTIKSVKNHITVLPLTKLA